MITDVLQPRLLPYAASTIPPSNAGNVARQNALTADIRDVDHPGPAQPHLLGDRPTGQAALAQPDHLPPALLLRRGRQLANVHMP